MLTGKHNFSKRKRVIGCPTLIPLLVPCPSRSAEPVLPSCLTCHQLAPPTSFQTGSPFVIDVLF